MRRRMMAMNEQVAAPSTGPSSVQSVQATPPHTPAPAHPLSGAGMKPQPGPPPAAIQAAQQVGSNVCLLFIYFGFLWVLVFTCM